MNETEDKERLPRDPELEHVIEKVSTEHGFDVRGYKRSTLYRRIRKRISDAGCASAEDYLVRLETDRHEYAQLINTILINVTEFFRDPEAWVYMQEECLAGLVRRKQPGEPVRAWSVGCASGEEAYSLAICLAEVLGERSLRDVKIYATDVDEGALTPARAGVYSPDDLRNVSAERLERFFEELPGGRYVIRRELRSCVIFGRHNVLVDPPISRLDTLVCRNLLIYFDTDTQQQLLPRFHYALREDGFLFLGKAETLMTRSMLFRPLEPRYRIFQRVPQQGLADNFMSSLEHRRIARDPESVRGQEMQNYTLHAILEQAAHPVLVLDPSGRIMHASTLARDIFRLPEPSQGRNLAELDEALRPVALRLAIEDVRATGRPSVVDEVRFSHPDGTPLFLQFNLRPVLDPRGILAQVVLWGQDRTESHQLHDELMKVRQELETVSEELQTTNEELETTNEELQSTNEELETTNEELQSTNEELETTIEELQSTNEELETANDELRSRQDSLNQVTRYQDMVLSGLRMGLIVLTPDFRVTSWNKTCEETWGLREEEAVGRDLFNLDIGLNLQPVRDAITQVMTTGKADVPIPAEAINRRGRPIQCQMRINPLADGSTEVTGSMLIIDGIAER